MLPLDGDPGPPRPTRIGPVMCVCRLLILVGQLVREEHLEDGSADGWRHRACWVRPGGELRVAADWRPDR